MSDRLRPVREVAVEHKNFKLRIVLLIVCLIIAFVSIGYGVSLLVNREAGWQSVQANTGDRSCAADFSLQYCFGQTGMSAGDEYRAVTLLYSQACTDGYQIFDRSGELAGINAAPGTAVSVSQPLYAALALLRDSGSRYVYLAPVYREYDRAFLCENEAEAALYDPARQQSVAQWVQELASYAADPNAVWLELQDGNTVTLHLSQDYAAFAEEYGITEFLDLGWLRNAFLADYIADTLLENGHTHGYVASFDGFTRNLDSGSYTQNLFHRDALQVEMPAKMTYNGPMALVNLRNYPMTENDRWQYFTFSDGQVLTAYADPLDGRSKSALPELMVCAREYSCARLALAAAPLFIADAVEDGQLDALAQAGINAVWFRGNTLRSCGAEITPTLTEGAQTKYSLAK